MGTFLKSFFRIQLLFKISIRGQARGWKMMASALLLGLPIFVSVAAQMNPYPSKIPPSGWYLYLMNSLFLQYFIWLIPLLYGAEAIQEEVRKGTFHYLWIRPIPRWNLVVAKFFATLWTGMPPILLAQVVCFFIYQLDDFWLLGKVMGVTLLGGIYFSAVFQLLGVLFTKPLPIGIIYGFFLEVMVSSFQNSASKITVSYYLNGLIEPLTPKPNLEYLAKLPEPIWVITGILLASLGILFLASLAISHLEMGRKKIF